MLFDPAGIGGHRHVLVGVEERDVFARGAPEVSVFRMIGDVHLRGIDRHRDLVRRGIEVGEHVAGVVRQPLGCLPVILRREGDRAAHLDDHVGHRGAHAGNQLVELGQALGALAVQFPHMQVQHGGAGVVAVHGLLDLCLHGDRNVFREIGRQPAGGVRCGRDDQRLLVFGKEVAIEEVHGESPVRKAASVQ
ncbi:hypothetical protein D9M72_532580 [compost metagenome]